ncbi:MAG: hypothetical protein JW863_19265 [Chitinispirillaceae bacterium]|nr:hypothetical protein [Chitinispirillaceae bacterium]
MNNRTYLLTAAVLFLLVGPWGCTSPVETAGGASGTDVGYCTVAGSVFDTLLDPVARGLIRIRPFDYVAGNELSAVYSRDVTTNCSGLFHFDSVPPGRYIIECLAPDSSGQLTRCTVTPLDTLTILPPVTVYPMAVIEGNTFLPDGSDRRVQVIGLERSAEIDSNGHFSLRVPSGWCWLRLPAYGAEYRDVDTMVYVRPGRHDMETEPRVLQACDSLACELQEVRAILDSNGLQSLPPESVVVIGEEHIVELHLRSRNLSILPQSVGRLSRLRVIDVGNNGLVDLPFGIDRLPLLEELIADSNSLRTIIAPIGMSQPLKKLDISWNMLQSLPEPFASLALEYLDVSGNMLCAIGEPTAEWLDRYNPGWSTTQRCPPQ